MAVTFVLGRAGTGKTRHCLDAILAELARAGESRRLVLLIPEQASFQMERALALRAPRQGYWRAEVLSFSRLARRVFDEAGGEPEILRPAARVMALRCVLAGRDEVRRAFGPSAGTTGFAGQLDRLIAELLRENVSAAQLGEAAGRLSDPAARRRAAALAGAYQEYLDWLGLRRIDPAQQLAVLRERMGGSGWVREAAFWVDGFAGFTGQELETLIALAKTAGHVEITLLLDPAAPSVEDVRRRPDLLNLFHRTETTYQRLMERLAREGVEVRPPVRLQPAVVPRFAEAEPLARLELGLAAPVGTGPARPVARDVARDADSASSAAPVRLVECETHRDELRAAARFIRQAVCASNGALRFRDFAVIARDLRPFAHLVADVFAEYELPFFLDRRRSLGVHALTRFVRALLETVEADFSSDSAIRLLRCGLLPLSRDEREALENQIAANEIRGFDTWCKRRWSFERNVLSVAAQGDRLDAARLRVVGALESLVGLARSDPAPSAASWARELHATLNGLGVPQRLGKWIAEARKGQEYETAELHRQAWDTCCEVLEDLHEILGSRPVVLAELSAIVGSALNELTVGLAPPTLDQVLVGSIERSRHPDIRYAWLFAFNEGIFPAPPGPDTLLSATEREALAEAGLPAPRPRRDEAFAERMLAYIALTRPSQGVTISYARVGADGEPRFASPLLSEIQRALPGLAVQAEARDEPPACASELARGYLRERATGRGGGRYERLRAELRGSSRVAARLEHLLRGLAYENAPEPVAEYARPREAEPDLAWSGSPSELEEYLQCPFRHFASYGLKLSAQRGPAPTALELGSAAHEIMAAVVSRAIAESTSVRELSDERWLALLHEAARASADRRADDFARRQPRAAFLIGALPPFLTELVRAHAERWRRGSFEPWVCERRFDAAGQGDVLAALELMLADKQRIRLRGSIDRIDVCVDEGRRHVLVYDYKSSPRNVKGTFLTRERLQLFTYLLAVAQAFEADPQMQVAGVLLAPLYPLTGALDRKSAAGLPESELRMLMFRPRGLFDADVAVLLDRDSDRSDSPVAVMKRKKDGDFDRWSDAVPRAELESRLWLARDTVLHVAGGLAGGRIDVAPLLENKTLACTSCEFRSLCRYEPVFNRPRVAAATLPVLAQSATGESEAGE